MGPHEQWLAPVFHLMNAFWSRGMVSALVSLSVGLLMSLAQGRLGVPILDAVCVGLGCWFCVDSARLWVARWRWRWLGHSSPGPAPDRTYETWPGWHWMVLCMVAGTALGGTLGLGLARWLALRLGWVLDGPSWDAMPGHGATGFAIGLLGTMGLALAISAFFYARERVSLSLKEAEAARRLAAESQLRLLQAQLEPHMLFNTLANLRVLIGLDPPQAQAMLDRLIGFLRATLSASQRSVHPLSDEFERLADYLSLMQVRMGPRLRTHLSLPDDLRACPVPPLLLQPLVENALLHGLEPKVEGGDLWVEAWQESGSKEGRLCIRVRDSGLGLADAAVPGFGVQQVRDRLAVTWGEAASLTLATMAAGGTEAYLVLPLDGLRMSA
jgi:hypothetical protein